MAIYKRPNSKYYWMKFWFDGELVQRSTKMTSKKEADGYEKRIWVKLQNGEMTLAELDKTQRKNISTFAEAVDEYLKYCKLIHANKPRTYERKYYSVLPMKEFFGQTKIDKISKKEIEDYLLKRSGDISQKTKEPITRGTINNELVILKMLFERLVNECVLKTNPAKKIKQLKENDSEFHVITSDEETFYSMSAPQPLKDIFILMLDCGFRPIELFLLTRKQVNLESRFVQVIDGKSDASNRKVYLTKRAVSILAERLATFSGKHLFPHSEQDGYQPVSASTVNSQHLKTVRSLKFDFRLYDARHSCATRLLENSVNLLTIAYILGHSDLSTLKRYAHPSEDLKREAIERLESARGKADVAKM